MEIKFFKSAGELRSWFEKNHAKKEEQLIGFNKKNSGIPSVTYGEALDQALAFGWIDGVRKRIDDKSYMIRFTPRKPKSYWSAVNTKHAERLMKAGLMHESGLKVFESRDKEKTEKYSFERENVKLDPVYEKQLKANKKARDFFQSASPSYKKIVLWWIMSAKQEATRLKRLGELIKHSENGEKIPPLRRAGE
ncbi:MAG TPA: YdeI/OmpD-associated family protein [Ignavibacteriaceae bacterium]|nr:YdeI/OmpD-associated family protein [Ignavibacteriaceae bacterium]